MAVVAQISAPTQPRSSIRAKDMSISILLFVRGCPKPLLSLTVLCHGLYYTYHKQIRNMNRMGKMPHKLDDEIQRLNMVAPAAWVKKIDDWRRREPDLPNLSEAIRRLVDMGLESA